MAEKIHASWRNAQPGRRLIIVRPAVIYGPGEGGNFTRLANSLKRGWFFYPGRKDTVKACGYVGELINTLAFAKALGRHDVLYNFCYPESYTIEHICEVFHKCGQAKKPMGIVPAWLLLTAARSFEILNTLGLKNSVNRARVRKLMESTFITPQFLLDNRYEFKTDLEDSLHHWRETNPVGELV
jgi:GlcNAc-P-P-Und epimerase